MLVAASLGMPPRHRTRRNCSADAGSRQIKGKSEGSGTLRKTYESATASWVSKKGLNTRRGSLRSSLKLIMEWSYGRQELVLGK